MNRPFLRTALITALAAIVIAASPAAASGDLAKEANIFMFPQPHKVADLNLKSPSGKMVSLNDFRGRVVLLHFWSINCPACRMEEPLLHQLKKIYGPSGLEVLAINLVDPPGDVINHTSSARLPFQVLYDGGRGFNLQVVDMGGQKTAFLVNPMKQAILEVPGFPTTYIVDCTGSAVGYSVGAARWDNKAAVALIQSLIARSRSCSASASR